MAHVPTSVPMPVNALCHDVNELNFTYCDLLDIENAIPIRTLEEIVRLNQIHTSSDYPRSEISGVKRDINGTIIVMPGIDIW
jgi:hypothetical protein